MKKLGRVAVYLGSRSGAKPAYAEAAVAFGTALAMRNANLVYGGAAVGLMGALADAHLRAGGHAIGVMPSSLVKKEIAHRGLHELVVVDGMHTRKAKMIELADAFVALPGGFGTLDELFEVLTWAQLGLHEKPVGLLNTEGFFDPLLAVVKAMIDERFVPEQHRNLLVVEKHPEPLLDALAAWTPIARFDPKEDRR
jgi:hypothetical protein